MWNVDFKNIVCCQILIYYEYHRQIVRSNIYVQCWDKLKLFRTPIAKDDGKEKIEKIKGRFYDRPVKICAVLHPM